MLYRGLHFIPSHVWHPFSIVRREFCHHPGDKSKAGSVPAFTTALGQKLHAEADAEQRQRATPSFFQQGIEKSAGAQAGNGRREGSDARQYDAICLPQFPWIASNQGRPTAFLDCARNGIEIGQSVIDDCDAICQWDYWLS